MLKDKLHLDAQAIAMAKLLICIPTYVAFLFGFARDRWNLFGMGDRGIFLLFAPIAAIAYAWLANGDPTYVRVLFGAVSATVAFRFLGAASQGLAADVGKRRGMTGRISTLWNIVWNVLSAAAYVVGGWAAEHLKFSQIFQILAGFTMLYFVIGLFRTKAVFDFEDHAPVEDKGSLFGDIKRIFARGPIWPAAAIWLLWSFAPGFSTALLFFLTDHVKMSPVQFGQFNAIFAFSFLPTFLLYGYLCRRVSLRKLLFWGTIVAVPQMIPMLFVKTPMQALALAIPIGLSGGVATAAYIDLLMRACPKRLEGTGMMIADAGYFVAVRFGDIFGTWLYGRGGFTLAVYITTAVYALILPLLLLVSRSVTETMEASAEVEEQLVEAVELEHSSA